MFFSSKWTEEDVVSQKLPCWGWLSCFLGQWVKKLWDWVIYLSLFSFYYFLCTALNVLESYWGPRLPTSLCRIQISSNLVSKLLVTKNLLACLLTLFFYFLFPFYKKKKIKTLTNNFPHKILKKTKN
jgi:hypothetical protein